MLRLMAFMILIPSVFASVASAQTPDQPTAAPLFCPKDRSKDFFVGQFINVTVKGENFRTCNGELLKVNEADMQRFLGASDCGPPEGLTTLAKFKILTPTEFWKASSKASAIDADGRIIGQINLEAVEGLPSGAGYIVSSTDDAKPIFEVYSFSDVLASYTDGTINITAVGKPVVSAEDKQSLENQLKAKGWSIVDPAEANDWAGIGVLTDGRTGQSSAVRQSAPPVIFPKM